MVADAGSPVTAVREQAKQALARLPGLYGALRWAEARTRFAMRRPHDPEYQAFRRLPERGLFVDIGANIGQSALSFEAVRPGWTIESFEANPDLEPYLKRVKAMLGASYTYHMFGLGAEPDELPLFVPLRKSTPLNQESTFRAETLREEEVIARVGNPDGLLRIDVPIRRFDDLGLSPAAVKIDVQGFELAVLQGMRRTLDERPPLLLFVEFGNHIPAVCAMLSEFHYRPRVWSGERFIEWTGQPCTNVLFLSKDFSA